MNGAEIVEIVEKAFKDAPRPSYFTYHQTDCDECMSADLTLDSRTVDNITLEDLNLDAGWSNPLSLITSEGFRYYFPALVRLCIDQPEDSLTYQIITHLTPRSEKAETNWMSKRDKKKTKKQSKRAEYSSLLTQSEKEATLIFLNYLEAQKNDLQLKLYRKEEFEDRIGLQRHGNAIAKAVEKWEGLAKPL